MQLFDPERHEPLNGIDWDGAEAGRAIEDIVADLRAAATPEGLWPSHPQDAPAGSPPMTTLYMGAAGVIWGLDYLVREGAAAPGPTFAERLPQIERANHSDIEAGGYQTRSFLIADAGVLLTRWKLSHEPQVLDQIADVVAANTDDPALELMWGAPGTMLVALALHAQTGEARWADLYRAGARALERSFSYDETLGAHIWTQDLYGARRRYLGGVHGFAGNAGVLIAGRDLIEPAAWTRWSSRLAETFMKSAVWSEKGANWAPVAGEAPAGEGEGALLVQHCHGAPGMVTCLAKLSEPIEAALIGAGELTWAAGPLRKGANLCHGAAGNGYAFLKLFERTGDELWLDRARAFAMHAISQSQTQAAELGRRRYSLWTGDVGLAIYLLDCLRGRARFPTMDAL